ncbi:hypothetical protein M404DRAFT_1004277 [Pisolithus tinctorius Marx 270]|uniref:Uncharacterized protein n=1 Tax=Pisolithus tinctorius Marx 270 TaxID=870435 RepID=A0A0C3NXB3_PISTI|nr:hypothetical protein M404DRAFT_1004277 [Pisolithus tinctorius Marx 270]
MAKKLCWMHPPPMEPPPSPPGRGAIQQQVHYTCYLLDGDGMSNTMLLLGEDLLAIQARKDRKGMSSITRYVLPAPSPKSPAPGSASFGFGLLEDIPLGTSLTHEALVAPAMNERVSVWDTVIAGAPGAVVDVGCATSNMQGAAGNIITHASVVGGGRPMRGRIHETAASEDRAM